MGQKVRSLVPKPARRLPRTRGGFNPLDHREIVNFALRISDFCYLGASRQENTEQHGEELPLDDELSDQPQEQASDDEGEEEDDEYRDTFQDDDDEDWVDPSEGAVLS